MSVLRRCGGLLVGIASLLIVDVLPPVNGYVAPIERLGDFTLYTHGEISKYNGYKGEALLSSCRCKCDVRNFLSRRI